MLAPEFNDGAELSFNEETGFWEPPSDELTNGTGAEEVTSQFIKDSTDRRNSFGCKFEPSSLMDSG